MVNLPERLRSSGLTTRHLKKTRSSNPRSGGHLCFCVTRSSRVMVDDFPAPYPEQWNVAVMAYAHSTASMLQACHEKVNIAQRYTARQASMIAALLPEIYGAIKRMKMQGGDRELTYRSWKSKVLAANIYGRQSKRTNALVYNHFDWKWQHNPNCSRFAAI